MVLGWNMYGQKFNTHPIALIPEKEEHIYFNDSIYKQLLWKRYENKFLFYGRYTDFVFNNLKKMTELYKADVLYTNMNEEEKYLDALTQKIIPNGYEQGNTKTHLIRDPSINSYCYEDGTILINIGLIAMVNSEAELAAVLSHDYGHYFQKHAYKEFKKFKNYQFLSLFFGNIMGVKYSYDHRRMERKSDLLAIKLFTKNGFSMKAIPRPHIEVKRNDDLYKLRKDAVRKHFSLFETHPSTKKRIRYLTRKTKNKNDGAQLEFQLDSLMFRKLKRRATDECIYNYFENQNHLDCIELSYRMHLEYPNDEFYLFFITESLRRYNALFPKFRNNVFITERYLLKNKNSKDTTLKKVSKSIHFHLKEIYNIENKKLESIANKQKGNKNTIEFVTNAEALSYFSNLVIKKGMLCHPSLNNLYFDNEVIANFSKNTELTTYLKDQTFDSSSHNMEGKKQNVLFLNNFYTSKFGEKSVQVTPMNKSNEEAIGFRKYIENRSSEFLKELEPFFVPLPQLNYRETVNLNSLLNIVSDKIIYNCFDIKTTKLKKHIYRRDDKVKMTFLDVYEEIPELYLISQKYNYGKMFFLDFLETMPNELMVNPLLIRDRLDVLIYCVDFENGVVYRFYKKYNFRYKDERSAYQFIYPEIIKDIKEIKVKVDNLDEKP